MATELRARNGVFISYARKDGEAIAAELRDRLLGLGVAVWYDRTGLEGGRDWWEQAMQALNHVEHMVLVMTPAAVASGNVSREWRFARQQGVCVHPVIDASHNDEERREGEEAIDFDSLPRWMREAHRHKMQHATRLFNDLNTRCQLRRVPFMAEPLHPDYVPREREFASLKAALLSPDRAEPVAIAAALRGAGGYGKTTMARALCWDDDIQNAFDDGILWVTLGEAPAADALLSKLKDLSETLSGERPQFVELEAAATRLRELLADRDILLVIDDVWRASDLRYFLSGGSRCARLITTRRAETLPARAVEVALDQMTQAQATQLLASELPAGDARGIDALARRLGCWPLLLKLANAWLRKRVRRKQPMADALAACAEALTQSGLTVFDADDAHERSEAVAKTLALSLADLGPDDQARLQALAVFDEDLDIPLAVLARYWGAGKPLSALHVEDACQRLFDQSLLLECDLGARRIRLHDAIRAWLVGQAGVPGLAALHGRLLDAYAGPGVRWSSVADDGYLHARLAEHLAGAGRPDALRAVLLDLEWMRVRLRAGSGPLGGAADVHGLVSAYRWLAQDAEVALVGRALRMSSHVLVQAPDELEAQLYGRLGRVGNEGTAALCKAAHAHLQSRAVWPRTSALSPPGALVRTFVGHRATVKGAFLLCEGRQALSWSDDGTLKLWDLERGELRHNLTGTRV